MNLKVILEEQSTTLENILRRQATAKTVVKVLREVIDAWDFETFKKIFSVWKDLFESDNREFWFKLSKRRAKNLYYIAEFGLSEKEKQIMREKVKKIFKGGWR